ncbi:MAG TPA: hypothetical protein V6D19_05360 [Stenomitos sp.]
MDNTHTTIKAQRATVKFCEGVEVEGYLLPDGEFRVGKVSASTALGFAKNYLSRLQSATPKQLEALQSAGFTGYSQSVEIDNGRGSTRSETLSLQDFRKLAIFAASKDKPLALALLNAIVDVGLEDWFRLSFGIEQLTLEEKRDRFYKSYAESINWLEQDKAEVKYLELPGDDNPHWNNATNLIVDYNWRGQPIYA